jgi:hypothetical protein
MQGIGMKQSSIQIYRQGASSIFAGKGAGSGGWIGV